ncbi:hypothetical protein QPK24_05795 [Paenibacillus polygoni]|uniref:LPS export ABC transporter periplasmic protein LptC n=1 Tax=Paenibacillus polygoni TaxID=3050112 RepID=A0ABY8X7P2_9BACL|nr:hypothetical protein [Paenibacillus polygoni]WIV20213.1 hypothetical protein QPK24_05795 [Paenibacillus polygoni]
MQPNRRIGAHFIFVSLLIGALLIWFLFNMNSKDNSLTAVPPLVVEEPSYTDTYSVSTNSMRYETVQILEQYADLIIIGTPTENFEARKHVITKYNDGAMQDFYTLTEMKINKIIKKPDDFSKNQETIIIIEPVGVTGTTKFTSNGYVEIQKGDQSVLFLMKNTFGDYGIINKNLGKFSLHYKENQVKRIAE